jgi:hypothetical protein
MYEITANVPSTSVNHAETTSPTGPVLESGPLHADDAAEAARPPMNGHEVAFSTPHVVLAKPTRWWTKTGRAVAMATARIFVRSSADTRPKLHDHPSRLAYLEESRLAREMDRL